MSQDLLKYAQAALPVAMVLSRRAAMDGVEAGVVTIDPGGAKGYTVQFLPLRAVQTFWPPDVVALLTIWSLNVDLSFPELGIVMAVLLDDDLQVYTLLPDLVDCPPHLRIMQ